MLLSLIMKVPNVIRFMKRPLIPLVPHAVRMVKTAFTAPVLTSLRGSVW